MRASLASERPMMVRIEAKAKVKLISLARENPSEVEECEAYGGGRR